jgi:hypothetical protein
VIHIFEEGSATEFKEEFKVEDLLAIRSDTFSEDFN